VTVVGNPSLKGAPEIEGLTFRHYEGEEDLPALLEVNTASKSADGLDHDLHTLETIRRNFGPTADYDPFKNVLIAEVNGRAVAYNRVYHERELGGSRIYVHMGYVLPRWRGRGIGRYMIHKVEERAREMDAEMQDVDEGSAYASAEVYSHVAGLENLLKSEGYEPVRYEFHMETRDLAHIPDVSLPEGLEIRPAKPEHVRAVWDATVEAFRDHWGATEQSDNDYDAWRKHPANQPEMWVIAWDGDQVAGSILNFVNREYNERTGRKLGYTENISVRRPWRRRGLARAMLAHSMAMFRDMGMTQTALGVDTQNPSGALRLYESMGYEVISRSTNYRKKLK
jgi:ribosomal protein S18 acetylase RimI-like enzyme